MKTPHPARDPGEIRARGSSRTTLPRALAGIVLFAVGFAAVNLAIDAVHWREFPSWIQSKFDFFEANMDDFDVVFLGSSYTKRQIDPNVFDRELASGGISIGSVNLATLGMNVFGSDLLARRVLSLQPKRLKWILIDIGRFGVSFLPGAPYTNKALWWHTPGQTPAVIRATFARDLPIEQNLSLAGSHFAHFLWRSAHLGMGPSRILEALTRLARSPSDFTPADLPERGFMPHRESQSRRFVKEREQYESLVREAAKAGRWPSRVPDLHLPFLLDQADWIRSKGVEPIYIVPPIMKEFPGVEDLSSEIHVFRYNDPAKNPQLFGFEARRDRGHLLEHAAQEYTRLIARDFAQVYANSKRR